MNHPLQMFARLALVLLSACTPPLWMKPAALPERFVAPPDRALLVVLRPSRNADDDPFTIVLASDPPRYLGQALARGVFTATVPEGRMHLLAKSRSSADLLEATVENGRVYFVLAAVRYGPAVALSALTPHSKEWSRLERWLPELRYYTVDAAHREAEEVVARDARDWVQEALDTWSAHDDAQRARRVLKPDDGVR